MNRSFLTQTFLSFIVLTALVVCVENSTKIQSVAYEYNLKDTNKPDTSKIEELLAIDINIEKQDKINFKQSATKIHKKEKNKINNVSNKSITYKSERINFLNTKKELVVEKVKIKKPVIEEKIVKLKTVIKEFNLELSYSDIEIENDYSKIKFHKIALSELAIDPNKYNKKFIANNSTNKKIQNITTVNRISKKEKSVENSVVGKNEDELVFFDYKEEKVNLENTAKKIVKLNSETQIQKKHEVSKPVVTSLTTFPPLSSLQKESLAKAVDNFSKVNTQNEKKIKTSQDEVKVSQSARSKTENKSPNVSEGFVDDTNVEKDFTCLSESVEKSKVYQSNYNIKLVSVDHKITDLHNYELRFLDNIDDIRQDYGTGEITIKESMTGEVNTRRAMFLAANHMPLTTEINIENAKVDAVFPVLKRSYVENILSTQNLRGLGGYVLVELDEKTEDVDLDINNKYEAKLYLNKNLEVINRNDSDYSYILFVGVTAGNVLINFRDIDNQIITKIIHVADEEIYYEPNFYAEIKKEVIKLYNETLLGKCKSILDIPSSKMESWNSSNQKIQKEKLNEFKLLSSTYSLGSRKYLKLNHLGESIFVGRWSKQNLLIPSEKYINHVLNSFNTKGGECLAQINLSKELVGLSVNGQSVNNSMRIDVQMLDEDGLFYNEMSGKTKKIFLVGEEQGIINLELEYSDGSNQYLQTYCSENTYLVEQL